MLIKFAGEGWGEGFVQFINSTKIGYLIVLHFKAGRSQNRLGLKY
jgi:hypothetical protein